MFEALLRKQSREVFNRLIIVSKLLSSDSAVVRSRPKLKSLVEANTTRIKTKFKEKFIENLFLDKFEPKILEYPQLDTLLEYQILSKHYTLVQQLLSSFLDSDSNVYERESEKLVTTLKELEFTGFRIRREDGGFGYLNSEYTFLQEAIGVNPSLSKIISENEDFGIQLISSSENETQKNEYLPKLVSGQSIACLAHLESQPLVTREPLSLNTTAVKTPDGYVVSGKKNWVYNASNADIIIFSANVISENSESKGKPVLFIADKNTPGIEIHKPFNLIGMKGLNVCEVSFNNVLVPSSCVLGDAEGDSILIKKVLSNGKLNNGALCIAIMKKLVNMAITHCIHNKFFNKNKYEKTYYRIKIGNIVSRVYTVESMTYLLTGRLDSHDEADIFLESVIGKIFASENLQYVLNQSLAILGSEGFLEHSELHDIIKNSQFFMACDDTNDHLKVMLSTAGFEHMLNHKMDDGILITMAESFRRNLFKIMWHFQGEARIRTRKILKGHLHLMFAAESLLLESSVFLLHVTAKRLIKKYGYQVFDRHLELNFLADIVINIYAMTATLGRASRAFCLGVRNDQLDKNITFGEVHRMYYEIQALKDVIKYSKFSFARKVGSRILNCKNFADQYPITENLLMRNKNSKKAFLSKTMRSGFLKHNIEFENYLVRERVEVTQNLMKKVFPRTEIEDYKLLQVIGEGSYGQVVCAQNIITRKIVAIKIIRKEVLKSPTRLTQIQREIRILNSVNFEFLISLECYFTNRCYVFVVLPYVRGGQFFKLLKQAGRFDEYAAKFFAGQVVTAFDYLHHMGIVYRDLKPENLVLDMQGYLKLVDFGFAKKIGRELTYTFCGTSEYLAPEILTNKGYNRSPDWWTLGILLYEMCCGSTPFTSRNEYKLYEKILDGHIIWPTHFSSALRSLIQGLLQVDKTRRLGCMRRGSYDVKNHEWFATLNWDALWHKTLLSPYKPKTSSDTGVNSNAKKSSKLNLTLNCMYLTSSDVGNLDFEI